MFLWLKNLGQQTIIFLPLQTISTSERCQVQKRWKESVEELKRYFSLGGITISHTFSMVIRIKRRYTLNSCSVIDWVNQDEKEVNEVRWWMFSISLYFTILFFKEQRRLKYWESKMLVWNFQVTKRLKWRTTSSISQTIWSYWLLMLRSYLRQSWITGMEWDWHSLGSERNQMELEPSNSIDVLNSLVISCSLQIWLFVLLKIYSKSLISEVGSLRQERYIVQIEVISTSILHSEFGFSTKSKVFLSISEKLSKSFWRYSMFLYLQIISRICLRIFSLEVRYSVKLSVTGMVSADFSFSDSLNKKSSMFLEQLDQKQKVKVAMNYWRKCRSERVEKLEQRRRLFQLYQDGTVIMEILDRSGEAWISSTGDSARFTSVWCLRIFLISCLVGWLIGLLLFFLSSLTKGLREVAEYSSRNQSQFKYSSIRAITSSLTNLGRSGLICYSMEMVYLRCFLTEMNVTSNCYSSLILYISPSTHRNPSKSTFSWEIQAMSQGERGVTFW